jgi:hypothetical protein
MKKSRKSRSAAAKPADEALSKGILSIDVGGTKVKILASGDTEPRKMPSGRKLQPAEMVEEVKALARGWKYDRIALGFPGQVGPNGPLAEPGNLGPGWVGFDFAAAFGCPVRIANDAAMQALGSYEGGRMLFLGLGTGVGSTLIAENVVCRMELGDLPFKEGTLSERLGRKSLEKLGKKAWREHVFEYLPYLHKAFLADYIVLGGGNSKFLGRVLPPGVRLGNNLTAFRGGFRLWGIDQLASKGEESKPSRAKADWRLL